MIRVITAPASYPVTRAQAKEWCRVDADDSSQDNVLDLLIGAMTNYAEHLTGRAFVERTLEYSCDYFSSRIELPFPPLLGVTEVTYTDVNGAAQTVAPSSYEVDTVSEPGRIQVVSGSVWPSVGNGFNPARIRYRAGYVPVGSPTPADNSQIPPEVRTWIAARLATLFKNREQLIDGRDVQIPRDFADGLLDPLVIGSRLF